MAATAFPSPTRHPVAPAPTRCPVGQEPGPYGLDGPLFRLYSPDFARNPHRVYAEMRRYHPDFARVELAPGVTATLVIGWRMAVQILHDTDRFRADPSRWQKAMDPRCSVMPMMGARKNALRSDGHAHALYRQATTAALAGVDLHELHAVVAGHGHDLVAAVAADGAMDLVADYAGPLAFRTINTMMGCPPEIGGELARGFAMMFEADTDPGVVDEVVDGALGALIDLKRAYPGRDIPTRLIAHADRMSAQEVREQVLTMYAAAIEPLQHLIVNAVLLMMTDRGFGDQVVSGACQTEDALNEVLFRNPPLANLCVRYPPRPVLVDGVTLPADQPVLIGMAACNTDPRNRAPGASGSDHFGRVGRNASHLSFSAGPHSCPARTLAYQCAVDAIDELLDRLPDLRLACPVGELVWRAGPFHHALETLPVVFTPTSPHTHR